MCVTKDQLEAVAREFIYDLAGVSQRDLDSTAEKIAYNIYKLIHKNQCIEEPIGNSRHITVECAG